MLGCYKITPYDSTFKGFVKLTGVRMLQNNDLFKIQPSSKTSQTRQK